MIPDADMILDSILRSMIENIIPSIDSDSEMALEHASLIVKSLETLLKLSSRSYELSFQELSLQRALVRALEKAFVETEPIGTDADPLLSDAADTIAETDKIVSDPPRSLEDVVALSFRLRQLGDQLVKKVDRRRQRKLYEAVSEIVLDYADQESKLPQYYRA